MVHLAQFRLGTAGAAVMSALVLNGLAAYWILSTASRLMAPIYMEYRNWWIGLASVIVALTAGIGGYLTYLGMSDPRRLPDLLSTVVAVVFLVIPVGVAAVGRRVTGRSRSTRP